MQQEMKRLFLMAILLMGMLACVKVPIEHTADCTYTPGNPHPKALAYQAVLDEYTTKGLPGIVALVRDSQGLWVGTAGKADIGKNIPMRPCIISKAASITKTFIGTLALKLASAGKFSLDDPISKWLPAEVVTHVKNVNGATIRQLLNHTTGIAEVIEDSKFYLSVLNNPSREWTEADLIKFVYDDDPVFPLGTDVSYSNTNFLLLAMVIEASTGRDHAELLNEMVIQPLNLSNTYYYWHNPVPKNVAQGYFDLYNNGTILNVTNFNTGSGNGYGGVYSNVFDLQTFIEALVRNKTVLSSDMLTQMLTFTKPEGTTNRANGLGIFKDFLERAPDQYAYGHRGRDLGYTADLFWFPEKDYTMAYLINYGTDAKSELRPVFYDFRKAFVDAMMK